MNEVRCVKRLNKLSIDSFVNFINVSYFLLIARMLSVLVLIIILIKLLSFLFSLPNTV